MAVTPFQLYKTLLISGFYLNNKKPEAVGGTVYLTITTSYHFDGEHPNLLIFSLKGQHFVS